MIRILVYAEVTLNVSVGPSLWVPSVADLFAGSGQATVDVLLMTPVEKTHVVAQVDTQNAVCFVDPWARAECDPRWHDLTVHAANRRLSPESAARAIALLDEERPYDLVIVRGLDTADAVSSTPRLAARMWAYDTDPEKFREPLQLAKLRRVAATCRRILCQTDEAQRAIEDLLGDPRPDIALLPPVVADVVPGPRVLRAGSAPRLAYAGKFSEGYLILEHLEAFRQIRARVPGAEFHVMGGQFRCSPAYAEEVRRALCGTPGVVWYGDLSRQEVAATLEKMDVASSWRDRGFDHNAEFSTKVLDYAAAGVPVLMNPSDVQVRVFGPSYPGYVASQDEFVDRFVALVTTPEMYHAASEQLTAAARSFTVPRLRESLVPLALQDVRGRVGAPRRGNGGPADGGGDTDRLAEPRPAQPRAFGHRAARDRFLGPGRPIKVRVAGHDLKFMRDLMAHLRSCEAYRLDVESWDGSARTALALRTESDPWADVVFCEWCHRNAEWYSWHKRPHQRLVVRLHRYEMDQPFIHRTNWDNVDRLVFITDHLRQLFLAEFPAMAERTVVIRNTVASDAFDMEKRPGAEFALGLLGILPCRKAPHLAVRIHEALHDRDGRYRLHVKGLHPWDIAWVWRDPAERSYYEAMYREIRRSASSRNASFGRHGPDVADWFSRVGFVLSTSEAEGSHQAVAEGMAAGCIPVIRGWAGAEWQYPARFILPYEEDAFVAAAVETVLAYRDPAVRRDESGEAKRFVREHFDTPSILRHYDALFAELVGERVD